MSPLPPERPRLDDRQWPNARDVIERWVRSGAKPSMSFAEYADGLLAALREAGQCDDGFPDLAILADGTVVAAGGPLVEDPEEG